MGKIKTLRDVGSQCEIAKSAFVRTILYKDGSPEKYDSYIHTIGRQELILEEIKDLSHSLRGIKKHAEHGLKNSTPEDYGEYGEDYDEKTGDYVPYDPYSEILYHFDTGGSVSVDQISERLQQTLDNLPELKKGSNDLFQEMFNKVQAYRQDSDGNMVPMSKDEVENGALHDYLDDVASTFSMESYTKDLRKIKKLAENRGSFKVILKLLR